MESPISLVFTASFIIETEEELDVSVSLKFYKVICLHISEKQALDQLFDKLSVSYPKIKVKKLSYHNLLLCNKCKIVISIYKKLSM